MRHFEESEFRCKCGCGYGFDRMDEDVVRALDIARGHAGVPFILTSSIRCKKHNAEIGSKPTSSHIDGYAVDIACTSSYHRFKIIEGLIYAGFTRIGIGSNFIHADKDANKPKELAWVYY